ncbi:DinB family protein [Paenibacillus sp. MER 99-2]|uniref:DinB family protein n=1 Tax=Paenibacillus sp. MER 99-2 TaxID=2939572 RepID=UPI00203A6817|nr:DinB family protein [Paenibacillus sp. MER 99-2]MCM3173396.1 DinB family protein [Paenibacillus sp. MER 99-2]
MNIEQRRTWNENHKQLTEIILNANEHVPTIKLFLDHHALLYSSKMSKDRIHTLEDIVLEHMDESNLRKYPVRARDTKNSIVWHLWHIARVEDITMNILVADSQQVLHSDQWLQKMNIRFSHSGNSMSDDDIAELSSLINIESLLEYRIAVGKQTRQIVSSLQPGEFRNKVQDSRIKKLFDEKAILQEASGIAEYWSKKTIAGLVLMPATRHNFLHLNKCVRIKDQLKKEMKQLNRLK